MADRERQHYPGDSAQAGNPTVLGVRLSSLLQRRDTCGFGRDRLGATDV